MIDGKWFAFPFDEMRRLLRGIDDFVAIGYSTADDCNLTVFLARLGKDRSAAAIGVFDKVAGAGHTDLVSIGEDDLHRTGCLANDTSVADCGCLRWPGGRLPMPGVRDRGDPANADTQGRLRW